ncbi:MAG: DUF72 domain-containing protein [Chitinispirillaceae bacterium]|nr:DUF72 domain-containing protein [Chitinispirillaceae bacterium]
MYTGCSGFYYAHWKGQFYPDVLSRKHWFEFYCRHFNTVEINGSFYRFPSQQMIHTWKNTIDFVNNDFLLTLKGNRAVTHIRRLHVSTELIGMIKRFVDLFELLQDRCGCILWQLPPVMKCNDQNSSRLKEFCDFLSTTPFRYAIEFRDGSWWNEPIYEILRRYNIAFCVVAGLGLPDSLMVTAKHAYIRFHGSSDAYSSEYSQAQLMTWAQKIEAVKKSCTHIYCYFNNDINAYAVANAKMLNAMLV